MKNLQLENKLKQRIIKERPIAVGAELDNGDMRYKTSLSDGTSVEFLVPKKDTYIKGTCDKLNTQEFSHRLVRYILTNNIN